MTPSACSTCKGRCATPQACHQPEGKAAPRAPTFQPTFGLRGPYRRLRRPRPLLPLVIAFVLAAVLLALSLVHRYH